MLKISAKFEQGYPNGAPNASAVG